MPEVSVRVDDDRFMAVFNRIRDDLQGKAIEVALRQSAMVVEAKVKSDVLTRSGHHDEGTPTPSAPGQPPANVTNRLRESITTTEPERSGFGNYMIMVGPTVVYGRVQELGGGPMNLPARPYLRVGFEESALQMREAFINVIRRYANG
jgi:phage gpG-like protein